MAQTTPSANPLKKAAIATVIGVLFLAIFGFAGYWYGTNQSKTDETPSVTLNANVNRVADAVPSSNRTITGTVAKVLGDSVEITRTLDGQAQTIVAKVTNTTLIQKWDFRTSKNNDKGVTIKLSDLKPGARVLIATTSTDSSSVDAQKVSMVIYP